MVNFSPSATLAQARTWLLGRADEGADCPLCHQRVQVYRRKITTGMARALIDMYRAGGKGWVHMPTVLTGQRADEAKLAYWQLIEEEKVRRPDGGRAGYWRVTDLGELFLRGKCTLPKYARVYNGKPLSLDPTDQVTIQDALGTKFNYSELMAGL